MQDMDITEEFLQFLWEQRLFIADDMKSVAGDPVFVVNQGMRNPDAGPDFHNAIVRIGTTLWAGNIEIHIQASDWLRHQHQSDNSYDSVILHVVWHCDRQITRKNGEVIPTVELPVSPKLLVNFRQLMDSHSWVPCLERLGRMDPVMLRIGFNRLMIERLQLKTDDLSRILESNGQDWSESLYQLLARSFGGRVNGLPFEMLARSLPMPIIGKHRDSLFQLEALFFGQSGMLHESLLGDDYFLHLRNEYDFLARKYRLHPMEAHVWKFARLRPVNFPTVRISQFACLMHQTASWFPVITDIESLQEIRMIFGVKASAYWSEHYRFNLPSRPMPKHLGDWMADSLIINALVPFLFVYGDQSGRHTLRDRVLSWMDEMKPEKNSVLKGWEKAGIIARSAFESQALLHLKKHYCDRKKCLQCHIGCKIINHSSLTT